MGTYVPYHFHSEDSLLDSQGKYKQCIDLAKSYGINTFGFSEHGNIYHWMGKKQYCEKKGIQYIHGCEVYLTESLKNKVRDNYHTVLMAKNFQGVLELNKLISTASDEQHMYYKPRISFDEFLNISNNIISTSACLASPLNQLKKNNPYYGQLCEKYTFFEVQPHHCDDQIRYNLQLNELAKQYHKPLILGTDCHSATAYGSECRNILKISKHIQYADEDKFDLTFHNYDDLLNIFINQKCFSESKCKEYLDNTNSLSDMIKSFDLDKTFKYPNLYPDAENLFQKTIWEYYQHKCDIGIIEPSQKYVDEINEEIRVFKKIDMCSFLLFMSELIIWCHNNDIPTGFCRGSVGGSTVAYILDIIDVDPIKWDTIFSRFANEDRVELGDIDIDFAPNDREKVYNYIINRIGADKTAYILTVNTANDRGTIDNIGRALNYDLNEVAQIKSSYVDIKDRYIKIINNVTTIDLKEAKADLNKHEEYKQNIFDSPINVDKEKAIEQLNTVYQEYLVLKEKYKEVFYYFDGLKGTAISQGIHPAGIVASPITLADNVGIFHYDGKIVTQVNMDELHDAFYVKYDILGLKNIQIIKDTYKFINSPYLKSQEINWKDENVWNDINTSPVGIFQFEGNYAFKLLQQYQPKQINDLSLVNAALRPSGASYRDDLIAHKFHNNPTKELDELLKDNNGFLVFQEDTIKFLSKICGFSGSRADTVRRAIGHKDQNELTKIIPEILAGYCKHSKQDSETAKEEAKEFIKIIEDSASYQFGYNHSTGYSMIGYNCALLRYYYPLEFVTAYLNNAANDNDMSLGTQFAKEKGIQIKPIQFRHSKANYFFDKATNSIYKGISSIKYCNEKIGNELFDIRDKQFETFTNLIVFATENMSINSRQLDILIKLNYFSEFGGNQKLSILYQQFCNGKHQYKKTYCDKTKEKRIAELKKIESQLENTIIPIRQQLIFEQEVIGNPVSTYPTPKGQGWIMQLDTKYSPKLKIYGLSNGYIMEAKINKKIYKNNELTKGCVIQIIDHKVKPKMKKTENGFESIPNTTEFWLTKYNIVNY